MRTSRDLQVIRFAKLIFKEISMKRCPYCAEDIKDEAVFCEHCRQKLDSSIIPSLGSSPSGPSQSGLPSAASPSTSKFPSDASPGTVYNLSKDNKIADRYKIMFLLGEGGMGRVFLVSDTKENDDLYAIKILPEVMSRNIEEVAKLRDEARCAKLPTHKNIVKLYHYDNDRDMHFLVMEYIRGIDLNTYSTLKGKLSEEETRRIGIEIAEALQEIHDTVVTDKDGKERRLIHRDIKPANIMYVSNDIDMETISFKRMYNRLTTEDIPDLTGNRVKLADFGIARFVRDTTNTKIEDESSGTLVYASPEQIKNEKENHQSDLYSLGVTLYELLDGEPPFKGDRATLRYLIEHKPPKPIEGITQELNDIILKLLSKKKEDRQENANELIEHLKGEVGPSHPEELKPSAKIFGGDGYLSIKTDENCEIWIDNINLGETKNKTIVFRDIRSGKHTVEGRTRYRKVLEEVDFKTRDVKKLKLELREVLCDLRAISDGIEYKLTIDGKSYECPNLIEKIPAGKKTINIQVKGLSFEEEIELLYDEINEYELTEEKIKAIRDRRKNELVIWIEEAMSTQSIEEADEWITELLKLDPSRGKLYQNNLNSLRQKMKKEEARREEDNLWEAVKTKGTWDACNEYVKKYPQGRYIQEAKAAIKEISRQQAERYEQSRREEELRLKAEEEEKKKKQDAEEKRRLEEEKQRIAEEKRRLQKEEDDF